MQELLLDSRQVALALHISRSYAYVLMNRGDIPTVRIGRSVRVVESELRRFVSEQQRRAIEGRKIPVPN